MNSFQSKAKRIMIVDDHPLLRAGITSMIESEPDLEVCCESDTANDALRQARSSRPDLVIIDLSLAEGSGLDLIKRLTNGDGTPAILVCSMHEESLFAPRVLEAGALGYISKHEATTHLVKAIHQVLSGKVYLSERMLERLPVPNNVLKASIQSLSDRELAVFEYIGLGHGPSHIARQLHISIKTVESHRENIKKKLQLKSGSELTRFAMQWVLQQS